MADGFRPPPRIKTALDNRKTQLTAPCPSAPGKTSTFSIILVANNPRVVIYTNDPSDEGADKEYGKITANLDLWVMFNILGILYEAIEFKPTPEAIEFKRKVENKNYIFPGGKRSETPVVVSELFVGKDKDGCVWISVTKKDRPRIKFIFGFNDFHRYYHGDGTALSNAETSVVGARGWARMMEVLLGAVATSNYTEPPPKDQTRTGQGGAQGGGSYGNRSGGQGGGYNNNNRGGPPAGGNGNSSGSDDDIPF